MCSRTPQGHRLGRRRPLTAHPTRPLLPEDQGADTRLPRQCPAAVDLCPRPRGLRVLGSGLQPELCCHGVLPTGHEGSCGPFDLPSPTCREHDSTPTNRHSFASKGWPLGPAGDAHAHPDPRSHSRSPGVDPCSPASAPSCPVGQGSPQAHSEWPRLRGRLLSGSGGSHIPLSPPAGTPSLGPRRPGEHPGG